MPRRTTIANALAALSAVFLLTAATPAPAPLPNLADHKTATASSSQGRSIPGNAVDGNNGTRWITADPKNPSWWMVDLGEPHDLGSCQITWEHENVTYQYALEGSLDGKTWKTLNDQRGNERHALVHQLLIPNTSARYVRISVSNVENAAFAAISEVRIADTQSTKTLPAAALALFVSDSPFVENIAHQKPALSSTDYNPDRTAKYAVDGTRQSWCASGPEMPQWWEVDLQDAKSIAEFQIQWENSKAAYRFVIEGSVDNIEWQVLSDQRNNAAPAQEVQKLPGGNRKARYVRITITGCDHPGSWACITEIKMIESK